MSVDVAIIGAGIFGLWAARHAIKRGESVLVLDQAVAGAGASGGFLGALMPHMPDRWNPKKQMQFEALSTIGDAIALLEEDTGLDCGFRRCGRLMPMMHAKMGEHITKRIEGANEHWGGAFDMQHLETPFDANTPAKDWLSEELSTFGASFDNLSARVNPRAYIAALAQYVRIYGELREGVAVSKIDPADTSLTLANGVKVNAGRIVVANGYQAYPLLADVDARFANQPITGRGVKGQAMLLEFAHDDQLPIIYDNGSYIVPHTGNRVAIGSTSYNQWDDPTSFDENDMAFYEHAMELAPVLRNAPLIERWASVRPRNTIIDPLSGKVGTEPIVGTIEDNDRISVAIGGFKISLGVGHHLMSFVSPTLIGRH